MFHMCLFLWLAALRARRRCFARSIITKEERDEDDTYGYGYEHAEEYACADVAACS